MRHLMLWLGVAVLSSGALVAARADPASAIPQETTLAGTPPALEGRWLLLVRLPGGAGRSSASRWEVSRVDGGFRIDERAIELPETARAARPPDGWEPTPDELSSIAANWVPDAPVPSGVARLKHEIISADAFDDAARRDPIAAGALWIVRQNRGFTPGPSRPAQEIRVLAAAAVDAGGFRGKYMTTTMALVPLPIPISVTGTFRLVRLPEPQRSFWARLADVFRGCR